MRKLLSSMPSVNVARLTYLLVCEAAGVGIALSTRGIEGVQIPIWAGLAGGLVVAGFFILVESLTKGFTLRGFSNATFGLCVGLFCAWLLTRVDISGLLTLAFREWLKADEGAESLVTALRLALEVGLFASLGFIGAALALRSNRDDFAFIIPYVRFRQDATAGLPVVMDADMVIDGRAPAVFKTGFLRGRVVVPRFVLEELQALAADSAGTARQRGQKGLENLQKMRDSADLQISVHDSSGPGDGEAPARRLIETARLLGARLLTADENTARAARLQGVEALNIFDLDEALRPVVAVGDRLRIALVRSGREEHQGVGYLPDGTMIVVNQAAAEIGKTVEATVVSTLQTNAGTLVFGDLYRS